MRCPKCGWSCDTACNEPRAHEALAQDTLRRRDRAETAATRSAMHGYLQREIEQSTQWNPGFTLFTVIWGGSDQSDLDGRRPPRLLAKPAARLP